MQSAAVKSILTIFLLLVFLPAAYAQPSAAAIDNAVSWAKSQVGEKSFPLVNGAGISFSFFCCADFVANAYGWLASSYYAYQLWDLADQHPGDVNAPRGSLVYFERTASNYGAGHVALALGNGSIIEAGYDVIIESTIGDESSNARYLGWAWPRPSWPGRSGR